MGKDMTREVQRSDARDLTMSPNRDRLTLVSSRYQCPAIKLTYSLRGYPNFPPGHALPNGSTFSLKRYRTADFLFSNNDGSKTMLRRVEFGSGKTQPSVSEISNSGYNTSVNTSGFFGVSSVIETGFTTSVFNGIRIEANRYTVTVTLSNPQTFEEMKTEALGEFSSLQTFPAETPAVSQVIFGTTQVLRNYGTTDTYSLDGGEVKLESSSGFFRSTAIGQVITFWPPSALVGSGFSEWTEFGTGVANRFELVNGCLVVTPSVRFELQKVNVKISSGIVTSAISSRPSYDAGGTEISCEVGALIHGGILLPNEPNWGSLLKTPTGLEGGLSMPIRTYAFPTHENIFGIQRPSFDSGYTPTCYPEVISIDGPIETGPP